MAAQLGLSWDEVHAILARAVERGLKRRQAEPVPRPGVDEKSFRKRHRYLTLVNDLDRHRVLHVAEGRRKESLDRFFKSTVAKMLKRRLELILNYCRHRITNARSEALNTKVHWVKATARGYRNQQNFINAIYFHCGALDLNPGSSEILVAGMGGAPHAKTGFQAEGEGVPPPKRSSRLPRGRGSRL